MVVEPQGVLTCWSLRLVVCVDSGPFLGLLLFGGPQAIFMVVEPQGVLTCWFSRLAIWTNSGPFFGLLLSFGVPK